MKFIVPFLGMFVLFFSCKNAVSKTETSVLNSDSLAKMGVDENGMKKYFLVMLNKGPNREKHDSIQKAAIQKAHLENITKLANEGKIVMAGPFLDDWKCRGIFIFNCKDSSEVVQLLNTDEAIKTGRLVGEIHPWYGSPALLELNKLHSKYQPQKAK